MQTSDPPPCTFFNQVVEDGYTHNISKRPFCLEKDDVLTKVVRDFYAHLTSPNNAFIYVWGASVLFDEYSINAQYGLFDVHDEHTQFSARITMDDLNQVLQDLCVVGTKWTMSRHDCYTVKTASLKPNCRVWYYLFKTRLILSTYNSTISKEQMLLLHSIIKGRKINMGKIIFKEVHRCTQKNAGSLNFPSLIATMCQRVNVSIQANEDVNPNKGAITKQIVVKFSKEDLPRHPPPGSASTSFTSTCATTIPFTSNSVFE
ncbi:hypothetical protein J1N35_022380 [Gossypium stocksii]|uniref:Putative plant transposon protein domain-containing protein n=1 Tax=Gossypium stocksii TaxID=47602 RepID=A0A9D3VHL8_9ROSI|nr:hypothetical protein J1N35_022380 [Gossypium stocksii]